MTSHAFASRDAGPPPASQPRRDEEAAALPFIFTLPSDILHLLLLPLSTHDLGRVDQLCHTLHSAAEGGASVVEHALRRRAAAAGHAVPSDADGEASMAQLLMWLERRRSLWPNATLLACGKDHSVAVDLHGRVLTCGTDAANVGVLGRGWMSSDMSSTIFRRVHGLDVRVVSVAAGYRHTLAVTEEGDVFSWGNGEGKRLGHGNERHEHVPKRAEALRGERIVCVAAGHDHSLVLTKGGRVFSMDFLMGYGAFKPVDDLHNIVAVAAGGFYNLVASKEGQVYSWGYGAGLGLGHSVYYDYVKHPTPIADMEGLKVVGVAAGYNHSIVITEAGHVYSWGVGGSGKLGHGVNANQVRPKRIETLTCVARVSAGLDHSMATTTDGQCYSWGRGVTGALGHGDLACRSTPKLIEALAPQLGWVVAAGDGQSYAMSGLGKRYRWGLPLSSRCESRYAEALTTPTRMDDGASAGIPPDC